MSSIFGVQTTGFVEKTLQDILEEIEEAERAAFGPGINVQADSVFGQLNGIYADQLSELWEASTAVYQAQYPDSASAAALDNVAAITGVTRLGATNTRVPVICTGTPATALPVGRVVSTNAGDRFATVAAATIVAADAWAASTAYEVGAFVENSAKTGGDNIYICVVAGTSGNGTPPNDGPSGTGSGISDGGGFLEWDFVGDGTGLANVLFDAEEVGAIPANAGAIDTEASLGAIETPVTGWDDAKNLVDGAVGRELETDPELRLRREQLLRATGAATVDAIRADVLTVDGVAEAFVFENVTLVTNGDGVPGKAFETVIDATGNDDEVQANLVSGNEEPYVIGAGQTLTVKVDGQVTAQTVTFGAITTAAAAAAQITTDLSNPSATARAVTIAGKTYVEIQSDTVGTGSSIEVTGGTANGALGFPTGTDDVATTTVRAVADQVFDSKPAGIEAHGAMKLAVADDQGSEHLIGVTQATKRKVYIDATLVTGAGYAGDAAVKAALVAFGDTLTVGDDVVYERLKCEVFEVQGVEDVTTFEIDFSASPSGTVNLTVGTRERAVFDVGRITIPAP
jgi:hypothetical protein